MAKKPIMWVGSSKGDLLSLPEVVKDEIGFALYEAQKGGKSPNAKPFKGFKGASVLEVVENSMGEAYRALYTVEFEKVIAVLHVFHKKSTEGRKTPRQEVELIKSRFKTAKKDYEEWLLAEGDKHEQKK